MTKEELDNLEKLYNDARTKLRTTGKWEYNKEFDSIYVDNLDLQGKWDQHCVAETLEESEALLIVAMRNSLPELLQMARDQIEDEKELSLALKCVDSLMTENEKLKDDSCRKQGLASTARAKNQRDKARKERDELKKRVAELENAYQEMSEIAMTAVIERQRYVRSLKELACNKVGDIVANYDGASACSHISDIVFRVSRLSDGSLVAEEVKK